MPVPAALRSLTDLSSEVVRSLAAFRRQAAFHQPAPPEQGLVLDIGAGHAPHPRADVIVDKYPADDFERASGLSFDRPLIVADGHAMPFADRAFDYVIASHVLEHATDVPQFAGELSRIAPAGFVQVPSRESELTFGWPFHPWLIDLRAGVLVFEPRGDAAAPLGDLFHRAADESALFTLWYGADRSRWHHTVHWKGTLPVEVLGESQAPQTATLDLERTAQALRAGGAHGPTGPVRAALRCPVDGGKLEEHGDALQCVDCGRAYPLVGSVPLLLAEAVR